MDNEKIKLNNTASNKKKILIVEDEIDVNDILKDRFLEEGFNVFTAQDGEEGLKKALEVLPDLILLDVLMPKMDGVTMLKELRKKEAGKKNIPVVMLTNYNEKEVKKESSDQGAVGYLTKTDWSLDDVVVKVKEMLNIIVLKV